MGLRRACIGMDRGEHGHGQGQGIQHGYGYGYGACHRTSKAFVIDVVDWWIRECGNRMEGIVRH